MSYERTKFGPQIRTRKGEYFTCETCGIEFYCTPSRIKQVKKNGHRIRFCSMKCYDKTGDKNPFWGKKHSKETVEKFLNNPNRHIFEIGDKNINYKRFHPATFKGRSKRWWLGYLLDTVGKCEKCELNDKRILLTHHIDLNTKNNFRDNILLLCPNCHAILHYEDGTGSWSKANNETKQRKKREEK